MTHTELEKIETDLLLEGIFQRYGYDFRHYARASLNRRVTHRLQQSHLEHISDLLPRVLYDEDFFNCFLKDMSITVTEFFRDPPFYQSFRKLVIPILKTYPYIKIWHPGCATGEEVYSMAMVLHEEGFLGRTQIYATDLNNHSLEIAKEGIYPIEGMKQSTASYNRSGAKASFGEYYHAQYEYARIHDWLKGHIMFANHNLVTDGIFGDMNVIICRNVLIYFDRILQSQVLRLFSDSLCHRGFLCLGTRETVECTDVQCQFEAVANKEKIYRKM